jgi:hypothetical protein
MPKTTLVVKNFQQGINTKLDDRDLLPGQLSEAIDVDVSTAGRIKCMGSLEMPHIKDPETTSQVSAGYGLFAFAHDYDMVNTADTSSINAGLKDSPTQTNTDYLVKSFEREIQIYDFTNETWLSFGNLLVASSTGYEPGFYSVDGGLRAYNGANPSDEPIYIGHVKKTFFPDSGTPKSIDSWVVSKAHPTPPEDGSNDKVKIIQFDSASWDTTTPDGIVFGYGFVDDEMGTWDISGGNYPKLYASYIYDNGQESTLTEITTNSPFDDTVSDGGVAATATNSMTLHLCTALEHSTGSFGNVESNSGNAWDAYRTVRLKGYRLYFSLIKDPVETKYLLLDADFEKGVRKADSSTWENWKKDAASNIYECPADSHDTNFDDSGTTGTDGVPNAGKSFIFKDPPTIFSYESQTGHFGNETTSATFKTACLLNRKIYAGNITQGGKSYNDKIVKTPVNNFDKFPELNGIEVAINDGDDIVKLEAFGDRILQFKRKSLYVLNCSQDVEFLEAQYALMGTDRPYQVVSTPYGVVWCNRAGVFLYGGEGTIQNLVRERLDIINDWDWQVDSTGRGLASIGFDDRSDKIIIMRNVAENGTRADEILVYDMRTKAWTFGDDKVTGAKNKSNMFLSPDGYLVWTFDGTGNLSKTCGVDDDGGSLSNSGNTGVRWVRDTITTPDGETGVSNIYLIFQQTDNTDFNGTTLSALEVGDFISVTNSGFAQKSTDGLADNAAGSDYRSTTSFTDDYASWKTYITDNSYLLPENPNNDGIYKVKAINQSYSAVDVLDGGSATWTRVELERRVSTAHLNDFNFAGPYNASGSDIVLENVAAAHVANAPTSGRYCVAFTKSAHGLKTGMTVYYVDGGTVSSGTDSNNWGDVKNLTLANAGATVIVKSTSEFFLVSNSEYITGSHALERGDVIGNLASLGSSSAYNSGTPNRQCADFDFTYKATQLSGFINPHLGDAWEVGSTDRLMTMSVSNLLRWNDSPSETSKYNWKTREIDFGTPGVRKKVYGIYVTFKSVMKVDNESGGQSDDDVEDSNVKVKFHWVGPTGNAGIATANHSSSKTVNYDSGGFQQPTDETEFVTAKVIPNFGTGTDDLPNNIYSIKLEFYASGTVPAGFEINDITILYRQKSVK